MLKYIYTPDKNKTVWSANVRFRYIGYIMYMHCAVHYWFMARGAMIEGPFCFNVVDCSKFYFAQSCCSSIFFILLSNM